MKNNKRKDQSFVFMVLPPFFHEKSVIVPGSNLYSQGVTERDLGIINKACLHFRRQAFDSLSTLILLGSEWLAENG
jgi:hypothetical protein